MVIRGFLRGLVREVLSLIGLVVAYFGAYYITFYTNIQYTNFSSFYNFHNITIEKAAIFIAAFILIIILFAVFSLIITKILNILMLDFCNRMSGAIFAAIKTIVFLSLAVFFLFSTPYLSSELKPYRYLGAFPYMFNIGDTLTGYLKYIWH